MGGKGDVKSGIMGGAFIGFVAEREGRCRCGVRDASVVRLILMDGVGVGKDRPALSSMLGADLIHGLDKKESGAGKPDRPSSSALVRRIAPSLLDADGRNELAGESNVDRLGRGAGGADARGIGPSELKSPPRFSCVDQTVLRWEEKDCSFCLSPGSTSEMLSLVCIASVRRAPKVGHVADRLYVSIYLCTSMSNLLEPSIMPCLWAMPLSPSFLAAISRLKMTTALSYIISSPKMCGDAGLFMFP